MGFCQSLALTFSQTDLMAWTMGLSTSTRVFPEFFASTAAGSKGSFPGEVDVQLATQVIDLLGHLGFEGIFKASVLSIDGASANASG